jgi:hypothetical protein
MRFNINDYKKTTTVASYETPSNIDVYVSSSLQATNNLAMLSSPSFSSAHQIQY